MWEAVHTIPDDVLWETRKALRTYLFAFIRAICGTVVSEHRTRCA